MTKILERRQLPSEVAQFDETLPPILQRIYRLRGVTSSEDLTLSPHALLSYESLTHIDIAVTLVHQALTENQSMCIVGDFDADGATSTALMIKALKAFGATRLTYLIPDRFVDGYGLSENIVKRAHDQGTDLIITVDNGISSLDGVALAKSLGINVIITDHHLPGTDLPCADAIINPNLKECSFSSKSLAGVGVAFYFMLALRAHLRKQAWFEDRGLPQVNMGTFLDLVALGTVADVVNIDKNNRILIHAGITNIQRGRCSHGIMALLDIAKKKKTKVTAADLGYLLAPRLNAAGRMENMGIGIELLLTEDPLRAAEIAKALDGLNTERRHIEKTMQEEAIGFVKHIEESLDSIPNGIVIFHPDWHQGIIGIISSRIKDRYYRPVISFALTDETTLKGSGRSIAGFHLRDALERIDSTHPGLIGCFGGHAMAAGLTIDKKNLAQFEHCFAQIASEMIDDTLLNHVILSDGELPTDHFTLDMAELIKTAGPWGQGFPEPLFDGDFYLHEQRIVGEKHLKVRVEPCQGGPMLDGIAFNIDCQRWPNNSITKIKLAYHLEVNEFAGHKKVQLLIRHLWV